MKQTWYFIRRNFNYTLFFLVIFFGYQGNSQELNYKELFGSDYSAAVNYLLEKKWMKDSIAAYQLDSYFALSVIFPELIRYNALSDYFETRALEVLYIQWGKGYADFSIGRFQMKPSFAENIEKEYSLYYSALMGWVKPICFNDDEECRKLRIKRLQEPLYQTYYLIMFLKFMDKKYGNKRWDHVYHQLSFYATAYNCGFLKPEEEIKKEMKLKRFHIAMYNPNEFWSYSDISIYFYKQLLMLNINKEKE